ncbi:MAG: TRAP transporter substrate-binding protein [Advenella sp.]
MHKLFKRSAIRLLVAGFALTLLAGQTVNAAPIKLRLAHVFAIGSPVDESSMQFAIIIKEKTNGEIEISVFPNSQLGGDEAIARDISRGSLDIAFVNPGSLSGLDPLLDIHYLPYIVADFSQADKIFYNPEGIIQRTLRETLKKHKMESLGFFELEFRALTNSKHPVETVADLKGLKVRVPGSAGIRGFFDEAGAQAVTMPFPELFTALQQGTVDGQDNGASITHNSRLFEAQKFMTELNHVYAMGAIVSSQRAWSRLDDSQKELFRATAAKVSAEEIRKNRQMNAEYMKKIEAGGVKIHKLAPQALAQFKAIGEKVWEKLTPVYGEKRIEALRAEVQALAKK